MRIAAFMSHPIQHFAPLWQELARRPGVELKVFYYSRHAVQASFDPGFGVKLAWDIDLLAGYEHEFLPRRWPTRDPNNYSWKGLNSGLAERLRQGWDAVYLAGYAHINNWIVARHCRRLGIPVLCQSDVSIITAVEKGRLKQLAKRLVVPRFLNLVSGCLAVGDNSKAYFLHMGVPPERVFFCPIPVDIARFRGRAESAGPDELAQLRQKYRIPEGQRLITFSGKLLPRKRPLDLVAAVQELNRDDVAALFIGDGELRRQIEQAGGGRVIVTGFVNQQEIPLLLKLGALSVMPSSYDAHPLAVTESLCLGVPVIMSDHCGCFGPHDVLRDGEDGFVYPCGDVSALAVKLALLLNDEAGYGRMSARAVELAQTQSPAAAADALLAAAEYAKANPRFGGRP